MAERVAVLGAKGFIGRAVVDRLVSAGASVTAASRRTEAADFPNHAAPRLLALPCDVLDAPSVRAAVHGAAAVVCCFRETGGEADAARAIDNVLAACASADVGRLVYLSSIAAYGRPTGAVAEGQTPVPPLNWYGRAKLRAEAACAAAASDTLRIAVVRPSLVHGPGGDEWSLDFIRSVRRGYLLALGPAGEGPANLVYVQDLAAFCARLALGPLPRFTVCTANSPAPGSFNAYFQEIATALASCGVSVPARRGAAPLAGRARRLGRGGLRVATKALGPALARSAALRRLDAALSASLQARPEDLARHAFAGTSVFPSALAMALGFTPATSVAEGARAAVRWAVSAGLVDASRP